MKNTKEQSKIQKIANKERKESCYMPTCHAIYNLRTDSSYLLCKRITFGLKKSYSLQVNKAQTTHS